MRDEWWAHCQPAVVAAGNGDERLHCWRDRIAQNSFDQREQLRTVLALDQAMHGVGQHIAHSRDGALGTDTRRCGQMAFVANQNGQPVSITPGQGLGIVPVTARILHTRYRMGKGVVQTTDHVQRHRHGRQGGNIVKQDVAVRIAVLGSGVVGVTTAFALQQVGHTVTVIEREAAPALGTSYGNAAQISPALSSPWASPGIIAKAMGWMVQRFPPLVVGCLPDPAMVRFLFGMLHSSDPGRYAAAKRAMVQLGEYSRDRMIALRQQHDLDYAGRSGGTFVLFRSQKQVESYRDELAVLEQINVPGRLIGLDELHALEPNVAIDKAGIVGAAHLPGDETDDCRLLTEHLAAICASSGVTFLNATAVTGFVEDGRRIAAVRTAGGEIETDLVVSCLGVWSGQVLSGLGVRLPIYPLKGYSLTIAAPSDAIGPISTIGDETYKIGITNLGDRIRVGGTAELAGFDLSRREKRYEGLAFVARNLFPGLSDAAIAEAERWSGLRPMTPDGPPLIGRIARENLFINAGHGTLGWTMACGAAELLTNLIEGRPGALDASPFSPNRYH